MQFGGTGSSRLLQTPAKSGKLAQPLINENCTDQYHCKVQFFPLGGGGDSGTCWRILEQYFEILHYLPCFSPFRNKRFVKSRYWSSMWHHSLPHVFYKSVLLGLYNKRARSNRVCNSSIDNQY